jgi:hypothetical protein
MNWLLTRFSEPSSYAGVGIVLQGVNVAVGGDYKNGIAMAVAGLLAFVFPEKKV